MLYQTIINLTKVKEVKTVLCYKYKLMRPSIGLRIYRKFSPHVLVMKLVGDTFNAKILMAFNYS